MTIRLVIDGNSVYEIDEDWEQMNKEERRNYEELRKKPEKVIENTSQRNSISNGSNERNREKK